MDDSRYKDVRYFGMPFLYFSNVIIGIFEPGYFMFGIG